jgi:Mrp family chromosome partitioning ATPase
VGTNLPPVLQRLRGRDRLVIVDAPPLHGIPETPLILALAQRIVLVVDASSTKLPEIERAVTELRASGLTILGVVVNRVHGRRRSAYGSYGTVALQPVPVPKPPGEPAVAPADKVGPARSPQPPAAGGGREPRSRVHPEARDS